jgi:hypothetical protein
MHNPKSNQKHVSLRLATLARNSINRIPGTLSPRKTTPLRLLQMFATQPPLETMILRVYDSGFRASARDIRNAKGVKVIDVLRAAEQLEGRKVVVVEDTIFPSEDQETIRIKSHRDDFSHFTKYRLD